MKRGWKGNLISKMNPIFSKMGFEVVAAHTGFEKWRKINRLIQEEGNEFSALDAAMALAVTERDKGVASVVQIGANDGKQYDFVRKYIDRYSMRGVLVEPNPVVFERLKKNYSHQPQLKFENVAIGETEGVMTLYSFVPMAGDIRDNSVFASLDQEVIKRTKIVNNIPNAIQTSSVSVITLSTLLERHSLIDDVTLLVIDTEGYDLKILAGLDFKMCKPRIIVYEHGFATIDEEIYCLNRLIFNGYRIHRNIGVDTIAVLHCGIQ